MPTLEFTVSTLRTAVPEPFSICKAVVEEIFCTKPPTAVTANSWVPPEL